jgi:hypothetical protein
MVEFCGTSGRRVGRLGYLCRDPPASVGNFPPMSHGLKLSPAGTHLLVPDVPRTLASGMRRTTARDGSASSGTFGHNAGLGYAHWLSFRLWTYRQPAVRATVNELHGQLSAYRGRKGMAARPGGAGSALETV